MHNKPFRGVCLPQLAPGPWQLVISLPSLALVKPHQFVAAIVMSPKKHLLKIFTKAISQADFTHCQPNSALCDVEGKKYENFPVFPASL